MKKAHYIALILVIIGALNWGMMGFFQIDVVSSIFGGSSSIASRAIYAAIGLAGLWSFIFFRKICVNCDDRCKTCGTKKK